MHGNLSFLAVITAEYIVFLAVIVADITIFQFVMMINNAKNWIYESHG
jgi:hypothetical protein